MKYVQCFLIWVSFLPGVIVIVRRASHLSMGGVSNSYVSNDWIERSKIHVELSVFSNAVPSHVSNIWALLYWYGSLLVWQNGFDIDGVC